MREEIIIRLRKHFGENNNILSDNEIIDIYKDTLIYSTIKLSLAFEKFIFELKKSLPYCFNINKNKGN